MTTAPSRARVGNVRDGLHASAYPDADITAIDAVIVKALADRVAWTLEQHPCERFPSVTVPDLQVYGLSEHSVRELLAVVATLTRREVARSRHGRSRALTA